MGTDFSFKSNDSDLGENVKKGWRDASVCRALAEQAQGVLSVRNGTRRGCKCPWIPWRIPGLLDISLAQGLMRDSFSRE